MLILAVESSAKPASAAVYEHNGSISSGKLLCQYYQNNGFSHSRTLMVMVQALLDNLGLKLADFNLLAVAYGPGSFTGIRIGVSAVKGLAFGLDIPVRGVSTLESMAYQSMVRNALICPVMDARRGQVYNALFKRTDGGLERICEDRAISIGELGEDLKRYNIPYMPVGDGADLVISKLSGFSDLDICFPCPIAKYQTAYGVAIAASQTESIDTASLEPVYLRPSQAERNLTAAGGR